MPPAAGGFAPKPSASGDFYPRPPKQPPHREFLARRLVVDQAMQIETVFFVTVAYPLLSCLCRGDLKKTAQVSGLQT